MIINFLIALFSALFFLFIFWLKLRDDYTQNQLFTTGFYILFGIGCGHILADIYFEIWWFWASFVGGMTGLIVGIKRFRMRFFESLEAYVISALVLYLIAIISKLVRSYSFETFILVSAVVFFIAIYIFLDRHYKKFTWYKSGKVGFSGLTVLGLFFLVRSVVAMSSPSVLSFAGEMEVVISGIISFVSFMAVYNLSGKT